MKKLMLLVCLLVLSGSALAIPLGGAGSARKERITGTFEVAGSLNVMSYKIGSKEVVGILRVNGITAINSIEYSWPKKQFPQTVLRNNGLGTLEWGKDVSPIGKNGAIQFNNANTFSADDGLIWDFSSKKLNIAGSLDAYLLMQKGFPVEIKGHTHSTSEISSGIFNIINGGTGSNNGSINGNDELRLSAGGLDKNVLLIPSGNGQVISSGSMRAEKGFSSGVAAGATGTFSQVCDIRMNETQLQKKTRMITVSGGIITIIGNESDWSD